MRHKFLLFVLILIPGLIFARDRVGYLGIRTTELSSAMKKAIGVEYGVLIEDVVENSPAKKAGLKPGDIIMEIESMKIFDKKSLSDIIEKRPEKKVKIVILREHRKKTFILTLGEREKSKLKFEMNFPNLPDFNAILGRSTKELKKDIEALKKELQELKEEVNNLKKKIK
ncbi:hypothetical protein BXT86_01495 [candidate division WOR-3 bacterium 4484_100]|uniref:PDZ domain-containing protein n=1 Tax=candidate division WOR-3 bacterium 4484_100 TaxID=1936077 RepID=A0A1V4QG93_UNCW3|nr:MAG: hypothetical protein BXT86_01495 [candidate division WOR-3 bacterium 4484_100]